MSDYIVIHSLKVATKFEPEIFGRLTTLGPRFLLPSGNRGLYKPHQVCSCTCGKTVTVAGDNLRSGNTQSCGCFHKATAAVRGKSNIIHGMWHLPEYSSYHSMKDRCTNHDNQGYADYGGRGIRVCDRWLEPDGQGLINFLADMGPMPRDNRYTLERKSVNGNYCPENCKWATSTEQNRNRRNNRLLTFNGKTQCIAAWAEELGIKQATLSKRIRKGWPVQKALTTPV